MKLELRKIRVGPTSRETNNFAADLYVDGKKCADVFNDGGGGNTRIYAYNGMNDLLRQAEAFAKTLPPVKNEFSSIDVPMNDLPMDLEFFCDMQVDDHLNKKYMERLQRKSILVGKEGAKEFGQYKMRFAISDMLRHSRHQLTITLADIKSKLEPGEKILNTNLENLI